MLLRTFVSRAQVHGALNPHVTGFTVLGRYDRLIDKQLGAHCVVRTAADGRERCLPGVENVYVDAACTRPAAMDDGSGRPVFPIAMLPGSPAPRYRVFERGAYVPSHLSPYGWIGDACEQFDRTFEGEYYEAGAELPPETFVAVREVRR